MRNNGKSRGQYLFQDIDGLQICTAQEKCQGTENSLESFAGKRLLRKQMSRIAEAKYPGIDTSEDKKIRLRWMSSKKQRHLLPVYPERPVIFGSLPLSF